jgi:hypothetical protein
MDRRAQRDYSGERARARFRMSVLQRITRPEGRLVDMGVKPNSDEEGRRQSSNSTRMGGIARGRAHERCTNCSIRDEDVPQISISMFGRQISAHHGMAATAFCITERPARYILVSAVTCLDEASSVRLRIDRIEAPPCSPEIVLA